MHCQRFFAAKNKMRRFPGLVSRKVLILDLDETLIHSHHEGVTRVTVSPGTPPDFTIRVLIENHPVRYT